MRRRLHSGSPGHEISCRQAVALVTEYLDGVLAGPDLAQFEAHLAECPACYERLRQIRLTVALCGRVRAEDLDRAVQDDLMALYRGWRDGNG